VVNDAVFNLPNCVTYESKTSLIELLELKHREISHSLLNVTYDQAVGKTADFFVSFAYNSDFFEFYFSNHPELNKGIYLSIFSLSIFQSL
jgi:hypothetical protein